MDNTDKPQNSPTLYLIRHGETAWKLTGQHTGRTDLPLTENGEAQARALAPWLAGVSFSQILTSPLQRARRTGALAFPGASALVDPDLTEWDYGNYEGRTSHDIRTERPDWAAFRDGFPGGETPGQIAARADQVIEKLARLQGNILLVSHGQFSSALAARWIGLEVRDGAHLPLDTASLSILAESQQHPGLRVISLWNAVPEFFNN